MPTATLERPFEAENQALRSLSEITPVEPVAPFQMLVDGVWLSHEEGAGAALAASGGADGLVLDLKDIGRSDWLSLSFAVPMETLHQGRYLAFLIQTRSPGFVCYRPCLRYLLQEGGFEDRHCRDHVVTSGGEDEQLSVIRIDPALLERSHGTEAHLFFHGAQFKAAFPLIETVLIA